MTFPGWTAVPAPADPPPIPADLPPDLRSDFSRGVLEGSVRVAPAWESAAFPLWAAGACALAAVPLLAARRPRRRSGRIPSRAGRPARPASSSSR